MPNAKKPTEARLVAERQRVALPDIAAVQFNGNKESQRRGFKLLCCFFQTVVYFFTI